MRPQIASSKALLASIVMGVVVWLPLKAITEMLGNPPNDAWLLWYWAGYPLMLVVVAVLGYFAPTRPLRIGPAAVFASYFAALYLVPQTGNMLPFELLWMAILSAPAAWTGTVGARFREENGDA